MNESLQLPIKCFSVSVVLIKKNKDTAQVLMLRRAAGTRIGGEWCQIVGGIEAGEVAWQAALRELYEETQIVPDRLYSGGYCEQFYETDRECINIIPVFVGFIDSDQSVIINHEHSDYRWMTFDEADAVLVFAGQRAMLKHVFIEFIERQPTKWLLIDIAN